MKKLNVVTILAVAFLVVSISANATRTDSKVGLADYEINQMNINNLYLGKTVKALWTISYGENKKPVTIIKRKTKRGTEYVVHSKYFELSYVSTAKGFGVKRIRKAWSNVPRAINRAVLNQQAFSYQEIITPNKVNDKKALGLIASYLPELINDNYAYLLN